MADSLRPRLFEGRESKTGSLPTVHMPESVTRTDAAGPFRTADQPQSASFATYFRSASAIILFSVGLITSIPNRW